MSGCYTSSSDPKVQFLEELSTAVDNQRTVDGSCPCTSPIHMEAFSKRPEYPSIRKDNLRKQYACSTNGGEEERL
jgi:hypothetical protein